MNQAAPQGHPAWQELLKDLPESLHPVVTPVLKKWDEGVAARISEIQTQYEPFKEFIDNDIDVNDIRQGLGILYKVNQEPGELIKEISDAFELGFVDKATAEQLQQAASNPNPDNDDDLDDLVDISKHPEFKAMQQLVQQTNEQLSKFTSEQQKSAQQKAIDDELNALRKDKDGNDVEFDDQFVLALMASGMSGEKAVNRYHEVVNQAATRIAGSTEQQITNGQQDGTNEQPPVVMGVAGTTGSGLPSNDFDFGGSSDTDIKQLVNNILSAGE